MHITMPNFLETGPSIAEILRFFDFSRWRPSAILYLFWAYLDHPQWVLEGFYHSAKFGYDRCSSFYNMNISIFGTFGWKMPIHAPKIGVLGQFVPLNGLQYQLKLKRHTLACIVRVIWAILSMKMWWTVWSVGELLTKWGTYGRSNCPKIPILGRE